MTHQPTAAVILIGNELLSGRTKDANLSHIATKLFDRGIKVVECRVISDHQQVIVDTVNHFRKSVDYVFTTGGIGATHDDITANSVGAAFGVEVKEHPEAIALMKEYYTGRNLDLTDARRRMARIPKGGRLIDNPISKAPGFAVENVFVMAGIPSIMRAMLDTVLPTLAEGAKQSAFTISCRLAESDIAFALADIQADHEAVDIGSYPYYDPETAKFGVSVVLRAHDLDQLETATTKVETMMQNAGGTPLRRAGMYHDDQHNLDNLPE